MAYKGKKLKDLHGSERNARIKQLLGNPGTRKFVPTGDLPAGLRAKRDLNTRLAAPIVEGSSITGRDLAHQRQAAETLQFGANTVGAFQNREKETAGWYDEFQRRLEQARQNTQAYGEQAQRELAGAGNIQGPAPGGAPVDPGNQKDAANAAAIRQALLGGMQGQLAGQAGAANNYANQRANVVGPGQKVQALGQARAATDARRQEVGAFRTKFNADTTADESKNVLAKKALGLDITKADNDATDKEARRREAARHNKAAERNAADNPSRQKTQAELDYFNEHGYWPPTGPPKKPKGRKGSKGEGPEWLTQGEMGTGLSQLASLKGYAQKAKAGQSFVSGHGRQKPTDRHGAAKKIQDNVASPKHPILLTAALDAVYDGHLSPATVEALIDAGYKPKQVARTLGVPTAGQMKSHIPVKKV